MKVQELRNLIENVYAQNYFAPNRVIPKSQRPKWRFMVKGFIKGLEKIPAEDENYTRAVKLLTDLFSSPRRGADRNKEKYLLEV